MTKTRNFLTLTGHLNFIKIPSVKPFTKAVTQVCKRMYKQIETYDSKMHYSPQVKSFWPLQYNQLVMNIMKKT